MKKGKPAVPVSKTKPTKRGGRGSLDAAQSQRSAGLALPVDCRLRRHRPCHSSRGDRPRSLAHPQTAEHSIRRFCGPAHAVRRTRETIHFLSPHHTTKVPSQFIYLALLLRNAGNRCVKTRQHSTPMPDRRRAKSKKSLRHLGVDTSHVHKKSGFGALV
jgi:hypothetical protein